MIYDVIYKLDSKSNIRVWWIEQDNEKYRVHSGIKDGAIVSSEWTVCVSTNVGKANERNPEEQCTSEIQSLYNDKLSSGGYHKNISDINTKLYFEPMLAKKYEDIKPKKLEEYKISQPKLDGVRCISKSDGLFSREGKPIISTPHIYKILSDILEQNSIILDGELYNHRFKDNFNKIISLVRKTKPTDLDLEESSNLIEYWVYDCFILDNPNASFTTRFNLLNKLITELNCDKIKLVPTINTLNSNHRDTIYSQYLTDGFEGQMLRHDSKYENKRSSFLLKRKEFQDEEFKIVKIHEGLGNWSGMAKSVEIEIDENTTAHSGIRGDQAFAKQLLNDADNYIGGTVTVRFQNKTPDGVPRFPVAIAFYPGKRDI